MKDDVSLTERLDRLTSLIEDESHKRKEEIELLRQIDSMDEREQFLKESNITPHSADVWNQIIKVTDKRRHTKDRLAEVRCELETVRQEKEIAQVELNFYDY